LAQKHEKPVRQVAVDLDINGNMQHRWIQQAWETAQGRLLPFPGHGWPRDSELPRLWKEVKVLREADSKKSGRTLVRVIFAQTEPR
jgi:transposase-like protein